MRIGWRFARKHRLSLGYYRLDRSGSAITATDIHIGDRVFDVDLPIASFLDMEVMHLSYGYSPIFDENLDFAVGAGLSVVRNDYGFFGSSNSEDAQVQSGVSAPVPTIGFGGGYAFNDKLHFRGLASYFTIDFALSDEEQLKGDLVKLELGLHHSTFEHFSFGFKYMYYRLDISWGDSAGFTNINYKYRGPALSVAARFSVPTWLLRSSFPRCG